MSIRKKVEYVIRQPNTGGHLCHWPNCTEEVSPALWGCKKHWFLLPSHLRQAIWSAYEPGQEISKTPSIGYIQVARRVQQWIKDNYPQDCTK